MGLEMADTVAPSAGLAAGPLALPGNSAVDPRRSLGEILGKLIEGGASLSLLLKLGQ